jgi:hypothetical protein
MGLVGSKFGRGSIVIVMIVIVLRRLEGFALSGLRRRRWRFERRVWMAAIEKSEDNQLAGSQARIAGYQLKSFFIFSST